MDDDSFFKATHTDLHHGVKPFRVEQTKASVRKSLREFSFSRP